MSDYYDLRKLCALSRIEIDDLKIQQTTEKIKEIISFFNKLDEFELNENDNNDASGGISQPEITTTTTSNNKIEINNYIKFEKDIDDLRSDEHDTGMNFKKDNDADNENKKAASFSFRFHNNKNGYVIGPRI